MAGTNKKQFIRRGTSPQVATVDEFEEVFARQAATRQHHLIDIPIDLIDPSPFQIRQDFEDLHELAAAMRTHGFTSHLWVRAHPTEAGRYQLIYGERRLRAARSAGISLVPCEVTQYDDREMLEIGLTENLQRRDLRPLEEAEGFQRFINTFGYSIRTLADRIGKDKGYIENRLRLLRLPEDVQEMVAARPDTVSAAREVARLPTPEARAPLIAGLVDEGLALKTAHELVDAALDVPEQAVSIVVEGLAAHRRPPTGKPTGTSADGRVERALDRDWSGMLAVVARWQARMSTLPPVERARLKEHVERLSAALEAIRDQNW